MPKDIISTLKSVPKFSDLQKEAVLQAANYIAGYDHPYGDILLYNVIYLPDLLERYPWDLVLNYDWSNAKVSKADVQRLNKQVFDIKNLFEELVNLKCFYVISWTANMYIPVTSACLAGLLEFNGEQEYGKKPTLLKEYKDNVFNNKVQHIAPISDYEARTIAETRLIINKSLQKYPALVNNEIRILQLIQNSKFYDKSFIGLTCPRFYTEHQYSTNDILANVSLDAFIHKNFKVKHQGAVSQADIASAVNSDYGLAYTDTFMYLNFARLKETLRLDKRHFNKVYDYKFNKLTIKPKVENADLYVHVIQNNKSYFYLADTKNKLLYG